MGSAVQQPKMVPIKKMCLEIKYLKWLMLLGSAVQQPEKHKSQKKTKNSSPWASEEKENY